MLSIRLTPTFWARLTSVAVAAGLFMEFVDSTALSMALPAMGHEFNIHPENLKLALTSYVLALAMFIPTSGWLADRFGNRKIYLIAIAIFVAGSLASAASVTLPMLVAARFLQGLGGALMLPVARIIIVSNTPKEELLGAMSWFIMPALIGPLVGPPLAGLILSVASWRWIFLINLPISMCAISAIILLVPNDRGAAQPRQFDWKGFLLVASAMTLLVGGIELDGLGLSLWLVFGSLALSLLAGWKFVRHALAREDPMLNVRLFGYRAYRTSMIAGGLIRLGFGASPLLLPLYFQLALGWSPLKTSSVIIGQSIGVILVKPIAPAIIRRFGFKSSLVVANLAASILTAVPLLFTNATAFVIMYVVLGSAGLLRSLQFTANNTLAYSDLEQDEASGAATLAAVCQQGGLALGLGFGGALVAYGRQLSGAGELTRASFVLPIVTTCAIMACASLVYARLPKDAGAAISGRS